MQDRTFRAHRLVLCAASAPFRAMLMGSMKEARQDSVTLEDVRADMFELWLEFVYGRDVVLDNSNVMGMLELAAMFDVADLRDQCCQALESALNEETAWLVLEAADRWQLTDLRARAFNFVINTFDRLATPVESTTSRTTTSSMSSSSSAVIHSLFPSVGFDRDFLSASSNVVIDVLGSDFLNAINELQVFEQATRWVMHHRKTTGVSAPSAVEESVLSTVRYGLIPTSLLHTHVSNHPLMQTPTMQTLLSESMRLAPTTTTTTGPNQQDVVMQSTRAKPRARTTKRARPSSIDNSSSSNNNNDPTTPVLTPRRPFTCKFEVKSCLRGHTDSVCAVKVFRNLLFSAGSDNSVLVWDLNHGTGVTTLREHSDMVLGLDVWVQQPTTTIAATAATPVSSAVACRTRSSNNTACAGTTTTTTTSSRRRQITTRLPANHDNTAAVEVCRLITCSDDDTIRVWNMADWQVEKVLAGHRAGVNAVLVVNGNRLYSGSKDKTIKMWELGGEWKCLATLEGHEDGVLALAYVANRLVSSADDWTVRVWNTNTNVCEHKLGGHGDAVLSLLVVGSKLFSASVEIKVWDTTDWTCEQTVRGHDGGVFGLASAGNQVFSASEDGTVKVWDATTLTCLKTLAHHRDAVFAVGVHNNNLISASADRDIILWT